METTGLIIYLMTFVLFFILLYVVAGYLDEKLRKRKERAERRLKCRTFETISYENFNVEKGIYEN